MPNDSIPMMEEIAKAVQVPYWERADFWIGVVLAIAGLIFSILAFVEARKAKRAATEAGRSVKLQTITIELTEISLRLNQLQPGITFDGARDVLGEISRRLRRLVSAFSREANLTKPIESVLAALLAAQKALQSVMPSEPAKESEAPNAVYYALQDHFLNVNGLIADLVGQFEHITQNLGGRNG